MAKVHAYLNFNGDCRQAFKFYQTVFKAENLGTHTYGDMPADPNFPLAEDAKDKVMHTAIHINPETMLMGADVLPGFGQPLSQGNGTYIMLDTKDIAEAEELFQALSKDAKVIEMQLEETFFAERFASFQDKFGVYWMIHFEGNKRMS
ncbi:VOC family protein [Sphingobacterium lactis]|uniref:VOC family protein n=1 Tax=Sphingobacterium lactis TaxID=797291 RepID=UPI003EC890BB